MFGPKDLQAVWGSVVGFGFTFEIVDDPFDNSPYRQQSKAISIWLFAQKTREDAKLSALGFEELMGLNPKFVGSITRETPLENRRWAISTLDTGWMSVIAAPTVEWDKLYLHRVYPAVPITAGYRGNFTVSLRPMETTERAARSDKRGLNLD
jgi:hypothetical protein